MARRLSPFRAPKIYKAKKRLADGRALTQWVVDLRLYNGKRRRLFFNSEAEATIAARLETNKLANEGMRASLIEPGLREEAIKCKDLLRDAGASLEEAVRFFLAHRPTSDAKTLEYAIEHFLASRKANGNRIRSLRSYDGHLRAFKAAQPAGRGCIHEVMTEKIEKYFSAQSFSSKTKNNHLGTLKTFFAYCTKRGWCKINPAEPLEKAKVTRKCPVVYTPAEAQALLNTALNQCPETLATLAIGLLSGVRTSELMQLEVHMLKLAQELIEIPAEVSKTRTRRLVPVSANLAAWLAVAPLPQVGKVFPHAQNYFYKNYVSVRSAVGVNRKPNAMRHSFATYHMAMHENVGQTARACGHSPQILMRHYDAVATKPEAESYWKICPPNETNVVPLVAAA